MSPFIISWRDQCGKGYRAQVDRDSAFWLWFHLHKNLTVYNLEVRNLLGEVQNMNAGMSAMEAWIPP